MGARAFARQTYIQHARRGAKARRGKAGRGKGKAFVAHVDEASAALHTYIHTHIHTYMHTYIHNTYIHTYIIAHVHEASAALQERRRGVLEVWVAAASAKVTVDPVASSSQPDPDLVCKAGAERRHEPIAPNERTGWHPALQHKRVQPTGRAELCQGRHVPRLTWRPTVPIHECGLHLVARSGRIDACDQAQRGPVL